jgi:hypothetical protein
MIELAPSLTKKLLLYKEYAAGTNTYTDPVAALVVILWRRISRRVPGQRHATDGCRTRRRLPQLRLGHTAAAEPECLPLLKLNRAPMIACLRRWRWNRRSGVCRTVARQQLCCSVTPRRCCPQWPSRVRAVVVIALFHDRRVPVDGDPAPNSWDMPPLGAASLLGHTALEDERKPNPRTSPVVVLGCADRWSPGWHLLRSSRTLPGRQ